MSRKSLRRENAQLVWELRRVQAEVRQRQEVAKELTSTLLSIIWDPETELSDSKTSLLPLEGDNIISLLFN